MSEIREVRRDDQVLWTESLGEMGNPTILLICGAGSHAHFWTDTFCSRFVDQNFFVIRYDSRDVGLSSANEEEYTLDDLAKDALAVLDAYHVNEAHLIGHSMGGYVVQQIAATEPEKVLSITLISSGPLAETPLIKVPHSEEEKWTLHETWRALMSNRPTQDFEESLEGFMRVWRRLNGSYPLDVESAKAYTQEMYTRSQYAVGANSHHMRVMQKVAKDLPNNKELLSHLHAPTLVIHGAEDHLMLARQGGKAIAEILPQTKLEVIPKMGHMFFNTQLEKLIADKIIGFIRASSSQK